MRLATAAVVSAFLLCLLVNPTLAEPFHEISIAPIADDDLSTYYLFPPSGAYTFLGVPFHISQTGPNIFLSEDNGYGVGKPPSATLSTYVENAGIAHVLVDGTSVVSAFAGQVMGNITFGYDDGSQYVVSLIPGVNIRDWVAMPTNTIITTSSPLVSTAWTGQSQAHWSNNPAVISMFSIPIPGITPLRSISFNDTSTTSIGGVSPGMFVYGVTVQSVPEPSSLLALLTGVGGFGLMLRRRAAR